MPARHRVLVSGATGDVAQGVLKALASSGLDLELHATCVFADSAFLHKGFSSYLAPYSASEEYIPFLLELITKQGIDLFIPTVDSEILKLALARPQLESETGVRVCVGRPEQVGICQDKVRTAEFLRESGFAYPRTIAADSVDARQFLDQVGFPVIAKPRQGRGSSGVRLLTDAEGAAPYLGDAAYCFQQWLTDSQGEYTTGVYLGDDGIVKAVGTLRRELRHGSTFKARRIVSPHLEAPLEKMAARLGLKYLNIQSRLRDDHLVPFEFNGRFSGTTGILRRLFNAPEMLVREWLLGESLERRDSDEEFVAMRYYDEVYATPQAIEALTQRSRNIESPGPV